MRLLFSLVGWLWATTAWACPNQIGIASWYGPGFEGKKTSSGDVFNSAEMTAAHNTLPFGSHVRVTDLATHKSVVVRINDRGGFDKYHRLIDLSKAAAQHLDIEKKGIAKVRVDVVNMAPAQQSKFLRTTYVVYRKK